MSLFASHHLVTIPVHTLDDLRLTGNCLKGSRPLLVFDKGFDDEPCHQVLKELLAQVGIQGKTVVLLYKKHYICLFSLHFFFFFLQGTSRDLSWFTYQTFQVPNNYHRSKPFIDHVLSFFLIGGRVWVRHYQIKVNSGGGAGSSRTTRHSFSNTVAEHDQHKNNAESHELLEIGPRFVLNPLRVFEGSFGKLIPRWSYCHLPYIINICCVLILWCLRFRWPHSLRKWLLHLPQWGN